MLVFPEVEYRSIAGSRSAFVAAEFMPVKMCEAVRLCRLLFLRFLSCRVLICLHVVPNPTEPALALVVDHHHDHPMNLELPGVLAGRHLLTDAVVPVDSDDFGSGVESDGGSAPAPAEVSTGSSAAYCGRAS
ncbi:MAG UNVERIFIED_CONTAM: hypothetical protein LVR18_47320 [Planctomycetaceae bacterium]